MAGLQVKEPGGRFQRAWSTARHLAVPAAAGVLAASLAMLFWPPFAGTYDLWVLESSDDGVLAMAESLPLSLPPGSGGEVLKVQSAKAALLALGPAAVDGLVHALNGTGGRPGMFHHRRAYAHILCAIGDRRAAQALSRARDGDVYVECFLLDCGFKSAAAELIAALEGGYAGRGGPPLRNAAGGRGDPESEALSALDRNFRTGFGRDREKWKKWWRACSARIVYDGASGRYEVTR